MKSDFQKRLEAAGPKQLKLMSYGFPLVCLLMFVMIVTSKAADGSGNFIKIFYGVLVWNAVFGFFLFQYFAKKAVKKVEE